MSDDYLWDGSGEPDPEVERLENLLSRYRHQPAPLKIPVRQNRFAWSRLYSPHTAAVAALMLLFFLAALSYFMLKQGGEPSGNNAANDGKAEESIARDEEAGKRANDRESPALPETPKLAPPAPGSAPKSEKTGGGRKTGRPADTIRRESRPDALNAVRRNAREEAVAFNESGFDGTGRERIMTGSVALLEVEAARHFEKAQMLLRSFRNASVAAGETALDLSYEKERSRTLLYKNIVLRRGVEARGSLPMEDVLTSLEPILLDIANLPERPSIDEVNSIRQRMQRKEIVATLQVYSAQASLASR